ncbi:MAG: recombination-associated protein RdgC [Gammaproteobacteria bacterium]
MWFKNLSVFRFTEPFNLSPEGLAQRLESSRFRPCGNLEFSSIGWSSPSGFSDGRLVHAANGRLMICAKKEEKVLPLPVINELAGEKILEQETIQGRKLRKKERDAVKEEIVHDLLPKAFKFSRDTFAYIDARNGWLIVNAATTKKAEELLSHLRKTLGSLPVTPLSTNIRPSYVMTQWLTAGQPSDIAIESECELRDTEEEGGIIRCKRQNLSSPEIKNHLDAGKQTIKLAVTWADRLSFILDENLAIKRLRFLDLVQEQRSAIDVHDETEQFDADFSIMSLELASFLPRLIELFGGVNPS